MSKTMLYALSTCGWCRKAKAFLDEHGVDYDYVYVDKLAGDERERVLAEARRWNSRLSFPTVVVDEEKVVVGFDEDGLREVLEL